MSNCNTLVFCPFLNKECAFNQIRNMPNSHTFKITRNSLVESYFISSDLKYMLSLSDKDTGELLSTFEVPAIQYFRRYQEYAFSLSLYSELESVALLDNGNTTCSYE